MINTNDYNLWLEDNKDFLTMLEINNSSIYDRLKEVFDVVAYIVAIYNVEKTLDDDLVVIFEVGFSYLFEVIEEVKLYYSNYFNQDYILFSKYSIIINYILYMNDLKESLIENNLFSDDIKNIFSNTLNELDSVLKNKKDFDLSILDKFNNDLDLYTSSFEILTTLEVFSRISEELQM